MKYIDPKLSAKRAAAGRAGGYATFFKCKHKGMVAKGRLGGRPRLLTLDELMSQAVSQDNGIKNGIKNRLSGVKRLPVNGPGFCAAREPAMLP
jgi:hypothetical protein